MTTKVPAELSSTPSIVDNGNATAITIGSDETTTFSNEVIVQESVSPTLKLDTTGSGTSAATLNLEGYRTTGDVGALVKINAINARDGDTHASLFIYANGDTNGFFRFNNTASTQIARLDTDGLKFGTDTAAANALDDYEEGTWSPTIIGSSGASGQSYTLQNGRYRIIGKFVALSFDVELSAKGTLSGPYVLLGGHGFTFQGANLGGTATIAYAANVSNQTDPMFAYINNSNIYLMLGGTTSYITTAGGYINNNSRIIGSVTGFLL